ncbi:hypothetical protein ACJJH9_01520 [Microbulbifer sp. DLAB2-AF]|uniref:hypothetical protein n=1 Tax=Microbulbifer sp. DLAB2-AF TaxID=3243395 RepID=UPI0040394ADA
MIIDSSNYERGLNAMMHASFFYYQLLDEGSFTSGQTAYWLFNDGTCWDWLNVEVINPPGLSLGVNESFIREAAFVYILCILINDLYELEPKEFRKCVDPTVVALKNTGIKFIPEAFQLLDLIQEYPEKSRLKEIDNVLDDIFNTYVRGRFSRLVEHRANIQKPTQYRSS